MNVFFTKIFNKKKFVPLIIFILAFSWVVGITCWRVKNPIEETAPTIGLLFHDLDTHWLVSLQESMTKAFDELNYNQIVMNAHGSLYNLAQNFGFLIAREVDLILVSSDYLFGIQTVLDVTDTMGIPVGFINMHGVKDSDLYSISVAYDKKEQVDSIFDGLNLLIRGEGNVVEVVRDSNRGYRLPRQIILEDKIKESPSLNLKHTYKIDGNRLSCKMTLLAMLLDEERDIDAVVAYGDEMAYGVAYAIDEYLAVFQERNIAYKALPKLIAITGKEAGTTLFNNNQLDYVIIEDPNFGYAIANQVELFFANKLSEKDLVLSFDILGEE